MGRKERRGQPEKIWTDDVIQWIMQKKKYDEDQGLAEDGDIWKKTTHQNSDIEDMAHE